MRSTLPRPGPGLPAGRRPGLGDPQVPRPPRNLVLMLPSPLPPPPAAGLCSRRRPGTLPQFGEEASYIKTVSSAVEQGCFVPSAPYRPHAAPPGMSPQSLGVGPLLQRATRPGRRRSVAPSPLHLPAWRARSLALAPYPWSNLKHGAPKREFEQIGRERTRGQSRPFRPGLRGRPPGRRPGSGYARRPRRCFGAPGGARKSPGAGRSALRAQPGGGPGAGGRGERGPRYALGSSNSGGRAAPEPRVSRTAQRALPPTSGSSFAPRKPETPSNPPTAGGRKVTWGRPGGRASLGVGTRLGLASWSAVRKRRRGEEAAAQGCSPRLPPPPLQETPRLRGAAAGPTPRQGAKKANLVPTSLSGAGEGATAVLQDSYIGTASSDLAQRQAQGTTPGDSCQ